MLEGVFINGLKLEIRAATRLLKLSGLGQIMDGAQRVKERNSLLKHSKDPVGPKIFKSGLNRWETNPFPTRTFTVSEKSSVNC